MDLDKDIKNLGVHVAGIRMKTPVAVGPVGKAAIRDEMLTHDAYADIFIKHIEAGAGFINLPFSIHAADSLVEDLKKKAKSADFSTSAMRTKIVMKSGGKAQALYLLGGNPSPPEKMARIFQKETKPLIRTLLKKKPKDIPMIGNIAGLGFFPETFVAGAKAHEEEGVDLIELNLSSPGAIRLKESLDGYFENNFPLTSPGLFLGDQPNLVGEITREVVKAVNIPVGVKISPETGFPRVIKLARAIREAGAEFIVCSNLGVTVAPPDIHNKGKTKWRRIDGNPFCDVGGDVLRMSVYKQVATIAKFVSGIDIMACGGLSSPEHIIEVMMLGARAAQLVTPMLYQGRRVITRDVEFMRTYMKEQGYKSVDDFIGLSLKYIQPALELSFQDDMVGEVDPRKCNGCGICMDGICLSIHSENRLAKVDTGKCTGCGLCIAICPRGAIDLVPLTAFS
jgi:dihydroorotate dehydrogenase/NAD-dependent dihydropyrimidine dehydrogenase PreA subunit